MEKFFSLLSQDTLYMMRLVGVDLRKYALLNALKIDLTRRIRFITRINPYKTAQSRFISMCFQILKIQFL